MVSFTQAVTTGYKLQLTPEALHATASTFWPFLLPVDSESARTSLKKQFCAHGSLLIQEKRLTLLIFTVPHCSNTNVATGYTIRKLGKTFTTSSKASAKR
jgi:hypothetical protein